MPELHDLPEDLRTRILEVQEKAGFVPNVFLALAHRPAEWRAFMAYHDALPLKEGGSLTNQQGSGPGLTHLGHRRHHGFLRPVKPDGQPHRHAT